MRDAAAKAIEAGAKARKMFVRFIEEYSTTLPRGESLNAVTNR
jgi:hypothetical protein